MDYGKLVFSGSGGQGVITAAIILAEAAVMFEGLVAVQSQSYGPEARGGATRSDVIISSDPIHYPKVQQPNVLVCLTQVAYNKYSPIIRPGGLLVTDNRHVTIQRGVDALHIELPLYKTVLEKLSQPIVLNICMLGALIGITGLVKPDSIMKVLQSRIPPAFLGVNRQALDIGMELGETAAF